MKRNTALQPLSHQHHEALMGCLLIRKGVEKNTDKKVLKDFVLNWWKDDLQPHLLAEEKLLLPYLAQHKFNNSIIQLIRRDHETIRVLTERVRVHENGYRTYNIYADLVEQHVRFEERVVFQKMQEAFSDDQLAVLGKQLPVHKSKCSDFPVKFWE